MPTTLNVVGDITAATYVARSEGYELLRPHEPAIVHAGVAMPEGESAGSTLCITARREAFELDDEITLH